MLEGSEWLECKCFDERHTIKFSVDREVNEVYGSIDFIQYSFYDRLRIGIRYIFGYVPVRGQLAEWLMEPKDVRKLIRIAEGLRND